MLQQRKQNGYAVVIVLILLVVGTLALIMLNRESLFFTKVAGFFSRARKIQTIAQDGIELAKGDLRKITVNSVGDNSSNLDTFAFLQSGGSGAALNQGLRFDYDASGSTRNVLPRISRTDGDFQLRVFYFPENPCIVTPCNNDTEYNTRLPKRMLVVSEALNTRNGEVFTSETRVQIQFENFAEIAFGVLGTGPYPVNPQYYDVSPGIYGRTHFNIPPNKLRFKFNFPGPEMDDPSQKFFFNDLVTFTEDTPSNQTYPWTLYEHTYQQQQLDGTFDPTNLKKHSTINFSKGYEDETPLTTQGEEPSSDAYFSQLESMANSDGYNFSSSVSCPAGGKPVDICLKFAGTQIKQYNCNYIDSTDKIMGRIDKNVHPEAAYQPSSPHSYTHSNAGIFTPGMENTFPDRYENERADVNSNTYSNAIATINANGVIYCKLSGCDCNLHVKGIVDGQVTLAAQNVVIEGDIQYQDQDKETSNDMVGIIAQKDVIVPPGIPQAATSATSITYTQQQNIVTQDFEPPVTPAPGVNNLHEAYLNITNFIPQSSGQYVDRDANNENYDEFIRWNLNLTDGKRLNSATTLDLDANIYAGGTFKVDTIFNPEVSANHVTSSLQNTQGIAMVTCENPPTCTDYKYRNPAAPPNDPNALYDSNGALVKPDGTNAVQPLYYIDGLNQGNMYIGQGFDEPTNNKYNDTNFQPGEEAPRPLNRGIKIFGGLSSKYHAIFDKMQGGNGADFKMGFLRREIEGDPRASFMTPPGYPATIILSISELHQKMHAGKSSLVPN